MSLLNVSLIHKSRILIPTSHIGYENPILWYIYRCFETTECHVYVKDVVNSDIQSLESASVTFPYLL